MFSNLNAFVLKLTFAQIDFLEFAIYVLVLNLVPTKFRRSGVPTQDSFLRQMLKVCILGQVEAQF